MSQILGIAMPRGYAGEITRGSFDYTTEIKANGTPAVAEPGVPVKVSGNTVVKTTATSDAVYGFVVRQYGQVDMAGAMDMNLVTILKRGYMCVPFTGGTPALGAQVYLDANGKITATATSNTAISGCYFMGAGEDGLVEIAYNI